jgi:hypothetical protein
VDKPEGSDLKFYSLKKKKNVYFGSLNMVKGITSHHFLSLSITRAI